MARATVLGFYGGRSGWETATKLKDESSSPARGEQGSGLEYCWPSGSLVGPGDIRLGLRNGLTAAVADVRHRPGVDHQTSLLNGSHGHRPGVDKWTGPEVSLAASH